MHAWFSQLFMSSGLSQISPWLGTIYVHMALAAYLAPIAVLWAQILKKVPTANLRLLSYLVALCFMGTGMFIAVGLQSFLSQADTTISWFGVLLFSAALASVVMILHYSGAPIKWSE